MMKLFVRACISVPLCSAFGGALWAFREEGLFPCDFREPCNSLNVETASELDAGQTVAAVHPRSIGAAAGSGDEQPRLADDICGATQEGSGSRRWVHRP